MPKKIGVWYWMIYHWIMQITCPKKIGYGPWTSPHVNGLDSAVQYGKEIPQYQVGVQPTPLHHWKHNTCIWVIWIHKYLGIYQLGFLLFLSPSRFRWIGPNSGYTQIHCRTIMFPYIYIHTVYIYICMYNITHQKNATCKPAVWYVSLIQLMNVGAVVPHPLGKIIGNPWDCYMGTGPGLDVHPKMVIIYRYWCMLHESLFFWFN